MSDKRITRVVVGPDGRPKALLPGGGRRVLRGKTDWKRLASMSDTGVTARARSDRDAPPVSRARLEGFERVTLSAAEIRAIRHRAGLSQAAFAARYGLSLRTLQDWEQGRVQPDRPARAYLLVIDREPQAVQRALSRAG